MHAQISLVVDDGRSRSAVLCARIELPVGSNGADHGQSCKGDAQATDDFHGVVPCVGEPVAFVDDLFVQQRIELGPNLIAGAEQRRVDVGVDPLADVPSARVVGASFRAPWLKSPMLRSVPATKQNDPIRYSQLLMPPLDVWRALGQGLRSRSG